MSTLQGSYTHKDTKAVYATACLALDDVVVALKNQMAEIAFSIYFNEAAYAAGGTPIHQDQQTAMAPTFGQIQLSAISAGTLDAQIRQAAYQWLQATPDFTGWTIVA